MKAAKLGSARSGVPLADEDIDPHYYGITNLKIMGMNNGKRPTGSSSIFDIPDPTAEQRIERAAHLMPDDTTSDGKSM